MFFLFKWLAALGHSVKVKAAPFIVSILQVLQKGEDIGLIPAIDKAIDDTFDTKIFENTNELLKKAIKAGIALFLGIEGLPDNPTEADIQTFITNAENALISKKAQQSVPGEVISAMGVKMFAIIKNLVDAHKISETAVTAAEITDAIEEAFQDLQKAIAAAQANQEATN
jgi:hypothetical protein